MDKRPASPAMDIVRFYLYPFLLSRRNDTAMAVDPPFTYPGPLRLLRSKMTAQYYMDKLPQGQQEQMEMSMAILDSIRHLPTSVEFRRIIGQILLNSYQATADHDSLQKAIVVLRGFYFSQFVQESRRAAFDYLEGALTLRFMHFDDIHSLEELIDCTKEVYESAPDRSDKDGLRTKLCSLLSHHYSSTYHLPSMEYLLDIVRHDDPRYAPALVSYITLCYAMYNEDGSLQNLRKAFNGRLKWLSLETSHDPEQRGVHLTHLVRHLYEINDEKLPPEDLKLGIEWCQETNGLEGVTNAIRLQANMFLAELLFTRYKADGDCEDIDEAVNVAEQIVVNAAADTSQGVTGIDVVTFISMLMVQAESRTVVEGGHVVQKALSWIQSAVAICPADHAEWLHYRNVLGDVHHACFQYGVEDAEQHLQESLIILEAAERDSLTSEYRPDILSTLSATLSSVFAVTEDPMYLEKSLEFMRLSATLREDDVDSWLRLGSILTQKYERTHDSELFEEAIKTLSKVVEHSGTPARSRKMALRELCECYRNLYLRSSDSHHVQSAIKYGREAFKIPSNATDTAKLLHSLSYAYGARFDMEGDINDLNESIAMLSLAIKDNADPWVPEYLVMLAGVHRIKFRILRDENDLEQASNHCRVALKIVSPTHFLYKRTLLGMSGIKFEQYKLGGDEEAFKEGVKLAEDSMVLDHSDEAKAFALDHMGQMFYSKYQNSTTEADLLASIGYYEEALKDTSKNSALYPAVLNDASLALREHMEKFGASQHKEMFRSRLVEATALPAVSPTGKVRSLRYLAALSMGEGMWGIAFEHLAAAIELYPRISPRAFTAEAQQRAIRDLYGVAQIAASCALSAGWHCSKALEVLEAGRGVMAGWLINARNDISLLEDHDPDLAARYNFLRDLISKEDRTTAALTFATIDSIRSGDKREQWRDYLYELDEIEETVRTKFPGMQNFQRSLSVEDMKKLAKDTPIIEINSSSFRSDVFIVTGSGVTTIELPVETDAHMQTMLATIFDSGRLGRSLPGARGSTNNTLRETLQWIYDNVVSKIMAALEIEPTPGLPSRRLIWVSNGIASFCPLHAAGTFSGNENECTMAHVVSSYIPSMKALQFARERPLNFDLQGHKELLVVAMPETKGARALSAMKEAENIKQSFREFPNDSVEIMKYPSRENVLQRMKQSSIAHFACHGYSDSSDPSESCLLLSDYLEPGQPDRLSAADLNNVKHDLARLCYLSACSTAQNFADGLTDENIHVASAFQLSGFSHVIGTLWEASDKAAVNVAKVFYDELANAMQDSDRGIVADDVVAYALHMAVTAVKGTKQPGSRLNPRMDVLAWAPFIHLGP